MKFIIYKCDRCRKRSEDNLVLGWYKILVSKYSIIIVSFSTTTYNMENGLKHVCGQECLNKTIADAVSKLVD